MQYWLLKTEPDVYAYAQLVADGRTVWDGVANAQAVNFIATMAIGDRCVIYHTGDERRCVGVAEVVSAPYGDPHDTTGKLKVVDVVPVQALQTPYTLAQLKAAALFVDSPLVRQGRLSVVPLSPTQFAYIVGTEI
jgi:predicted RNA-binding protein with PUA-like domain